MKYLDVEPLDVGGQAPVDLLKRRHNSGLDDGRRRRMKGYCVACVFHVNAESVEKMKAIIDSVYKKSLKEKGCLEYRWYQSENDPTDFLLFMTWKVKML